MPDVFLWLHIVAAATYIGGMIFLATSVVPYARRLDSQERGEIIRGVGRKFRVVSWIAIVILIVTGFAMLGQLQMTSQIGTHAALTWKLGLFVLMILLSLLHDLIAKKMAANPSNTISLRTFASWSGRITLILGLIVMYLATQIL